MSYTAEEFIDYSFGTACLCGSTKYFFEAMEANRKLTFKNWIVLQCGSWGHSFHKYSEETNSNFESVKKLHFKKILIKLHFKKILISDIVVVVSNNSDYIGDSTKAEITFAKRRNIPVFYFNGDKFTGKTECPIFNNLPDESLIDQFAESYGGLGF